MWNSNCTVIWEVMLYNASDILKFFFYLQWRVESDSSLPSIAIMATLFWSPVSSSIFLLFCLNLFNSLLSSPVYIFKTCHWSVSIIKYRYGNMIDFVWTKSANTRWTNIERVFTLLTGPFASSPGAFCRGDKYINMNCKNKKFSCKKTQNFKNLASEAVSVKPLIIN